MEVFRLARKPYAEILSGVGAAAKGRRWNSKGTDLIYSAANRSLAMSEVAVHFTLSTLPVDYMMVTIYVPDQSSRDIIRISDLPDYWNSFPHSTSVQKIGDNFVIQNKHCILQVPSAVTRGDFNYLFNPKHPEFKYIKIINVENFPFDKRIFN